MLRADLLLQSRYASLSSGLVGESRYLRRALIAARRSWSVRHSRAEFADYFANAYSESDLSVSRTTAVFTSIDSETLAA